MVFVYLVIGGVLGIGIFLLITKFRTKNYEKLSSEDAVWFVPHIEHAARKAYTHLEKHGAPLWERMKRFGIRTYISALTWIRHHIHLHLTHVTTHHYRRIAHEKNGARVADNSEKKG